jgi:hypothetical protein
LACVSNRPFYPIAAEKQKQYYFDTAKIAAKDGQDPKYGIW